MEKAIQVKRLQKSYKKLNVLKGVDFEVKKVEYSPCSDPMVRARQRSSRFSPRCSNKMAELHMLPASMSQHSPMR